MRSSVDTLDPEDKSRFVIIFAMLYENYYCDNSFSKIIELFQNDTKENRDLKSYAILKISEHDSVCILDESKYCKPIYFFKQKFRLKDYINFNSTDEIVELNLLLSILTSKEQIKKSIYHLAIFKYLNDHPIYNIIIHKSKENKNNLYIHTISKLPIMNLKIDSKENSEVLLDFKLFYEKYPTINVDFDINLEKNIFNKNIMFLNKCKSDMFQAIFYRHSVFANDENDIYSFLNLFKEFDDDYYKNVISKRLSDSENFIVENCNATITEYDNEFSNTSMENVTLFILNINKFIKSLKIKKEAP
jgi:hypothetical protein